jgi:hypothetical protein
MPPQARLAAASTSNFRMVGTRKLTHEIGSDYRESPSECSHKATSPGHGGKIGGKF